MKLKKILATTTVAAALGFGALGAGGTVANADPPPWIPGPGHGHGHDGPGNNGPGRGDDWLGGPGPRHDDVWQAGDWNVGGQDWWRGRPGKWWRDGDLPPWGFWGAPPPAQWAGPPPWVNPHPINYWGYNANPVWDDGFQTWGIWLFGIFIPIVGIGTV